MFSLCRIIAAIEDCAMLLTLKVLQKQYSCELRQFVNNECKEIFEIKSSTSTQNRTGHAQCFCGTLTLTSTTTH